MIHTDYHGHTTMSHGECSIEEYVRTAYERGLSTITISEHAPANMFYGVKRKGFDAIREKIKELNVEYAGRAKLLFGIELNLLGYERVDLPKGMDFDVVILGYHRGIFPTSAFAFRALLEAGGIGSSAMKNTEMYISVMKNTHIDIIAHPGEYIAIDKKRLAIAAAVRNIAIEINNRHLTLTADDLKLFADCGAEFVISSDAHAKSEIASFDTAVAVAREAGVLELVRNYSE